MNKATVITAALSICALASVAIAQDPTPAPTPVPPTPAVKPTPAPTPTPKAKRRPVLSGEWGELGISGLEANLDALRAIEITPPPDLMIEHMPDLDFEMP
ncbi:MAG: hypothetical protein ACJ785_02705, partial [Gemmatimonadaceae bacterium]